MSGDVANAECPADDMVCAVCNNLLQKPRLLPCLHSICFECLQRILNTNKTADTIECPKCEESIEITAHEPEDFPSNEYLITKISIYSSKHGVDKQCVVCGLRKKKNPAMFKCLDCEDFLCDTCGTAHSSTRMTIDHDVMSLDELARGTHDDTIKEKRMMYCQAHEKDILDYYCKNCNILVCRECRLDFHFDHISLPVTEVDDAKRGKITEVISRFDMKIKELFDADIESETVVRELEKSEQAVIDEVESTSKQLKERIEKEKTEIIENVKKHVAAEKERCNEQKSEINKRHELLRFGTEFCANVATNGKEAEIIYMEPALSGRLRELDRLPQPNTDIGCYLPEVKMRNLYGNIDNMRFFEFNAGIPSTVRSFLPPGVEESDIPKVLSLTLKRRINVFSSDDQTSPKITGMCINNNELFVSDYSNRKIKIFSLKGEQIDTIHSVGAFSIAVVDDIIAISDHFAITFISRDESVKYRVDLESTSASYPLAAMHGNAFVVANSKQHVFMKYDRHGTNIENYKMARSQRKSFSRAVTFVSTTNSGDLVASDWGTNSVVVMGTDGKVKLEYTGKSLSYTKDWSPGGVCVDMHDNIFLVDQRQSNITVLSPAGKVVHRHNTKKDGLERPLNITTDNNSYMYISGKGGLIHVYLTEYI